MTGGRAWGEAIDPNPNRDPGTPPTLYACQGYGAENLWKSTDGGVTWTMKSLGSLNQGVYSIDADPYDGMHLIVGFHEAGGLAESTDGGVTWRAVTTPAGTSWYAFFVNTGSASTTRSTWLALPQDFSGGAGAFRTTNSGGAWNQAGTFVHPHGGSQLFNAGNGVFFIGATGGVYKSADYCATFTKVSTIDAGNVIGTPSYLYTSRFQAWPTPADNQDPLLQRAPLNPGTAWQSISKPSGMCDGAKRSAVSFDETRYVVVSGNWRCGIWRYVEP